MRAPQTNGVELRFCAGLPRRQPADVRGVGDTPVTRDWSSARLWLTPELAS
jgi:hypothetical protein